MPRISFECQYRALARILNSQDLRLYFPGRIRRALSQHFYFARNHRKSAARFAERAASIAAFNARRFVWDATVVIKFTTSPILAATLTSCSMRLSVNSAYRTACCATSLDARDCRLTSPDDVEICAVASLTRRTSLEASARRRQPKSPAVWSRQRLCRE